MRFAIVALSILATDVVASAQTPRVEFQRIVDAGAARIGWVSESPNRRMILAGVEEKPGGNTVVRVYHRATRTWHDLGPADLDYAWSPHSDRLAFARVDESGSSLFIWTMPIDSLTGRATGPARRISRRTGRGPAFSADGRTVAFTVLPASDQGGPRIVAIPVNGGPEHVLTNEPGWTQTLQFTRDGRWLYYRHRLRSVDGQGLASIRRVAPNGGEPAEVRKARGYFGLSGDGRFMAYRIGAENRAPKPEITIASAEGKELFQVPVTPRMNVIGWSMHGAALLSLLETPQTELRVASGTSGTRVPFAAPGNASEDMPSWSPDGTRIAFVRIEGDRSQLVVARADGTRRRVLNRSEQPATISLWSPDGRRIAYGAKSGKVMVVDLITGGEKAVPNLSRVDVLQWSRGGASLEALQQTGDGVVWRTVDLSGRVRNVRTLPESTRRTTHTFVGDSVVIQATPLEVMAIPRSGSPRTIFQPATGERAEYLVVHASPDGRFVAIPVGKSDARGGDHRSVHIIPIARGTRRTLELPNAQYTGFFWHPDGRHLVTVFDEGPDTPYQLALVPVNGEPLRRLAAQNASNIAFAPNGQQFVYSAMTGSSSSIWELDVAAARAQDQ